MKDNNLLGFIVIDILLAVGVIWGLMMGYKLLGYGLLVYFVINTLALVLKLAGNRREEWPLHRHEPDLQRESL